MEFWFFFSLFIAVYYVVFMKWIMEMIFFFQIYKWCQLIRCGSRAYDAVGIKYIFQFQYSRLCNFSTLRTEEVSWKKNTILKTLETQNRLNELDNLKSNHIHWDNDSNINWRTVWIALIISNIDRANDFFSHKISKKNQFTVYNVSSICVIESIHGYIVIIFFFRVKLFFSPINLILIVEAFSNELFYLQICFLLKICRFHVKKKNKFNCFHVYRMKLRVG